MIYGLDTGFLVAAEVAEHAEHTAARETLTRLLDMLLAVTYHQAGVRSLLTTNPADFRVFGAFTCVTPTATPASH